MITKLDPSASSESVLTRKWSCLWRPDVGSSLSARSSWQKAGCVGGLAWLQTGSAQNLSTGGTSGAIVTGTHRFRQQLDVGGKIKNSVKRGGNRQMTKKGDVGSVAVPE